MAPVRTILRRLANEERAAKGLPPIGSPDDPPPSSVAQWLERLKERRPSPCVECGDMTTNSFFGVTLCEPYDNDGHVIKRCKWKYRDRTGG